MNTPRNSTGRKIIEAPKYFTASGVISFIDSCEIVFKLNNQLVPGYKLDAFKVKKISMLGVLLIYKIIEYSYTNNCLLKPDLHYNNLTKDALEQYGFKQLIEAYFNKRNSEGGYKNLKVSYANNFIIAPHALLRNNSYSRNSLRDKYLPQIEKYYDYNPKVVSMIFQALSEVILNFWEHAVEDSKSIIVANGTKQNIEIACADSGNGIIDTLSTALALSALEPEAILQQAVLRGVTSKRNTDHMGYGLWILDEIVTRTKGRMHIYSQGAYYYNDGGTIKSGKCGYWQGCIIYLSLPLHRPITLSDIQPDDINDEILKINWG
ncbi:MAG: hypothetical protein ACO1OF_16245 [Adhaeribacter sp.]